MGSGGSWALPLHGKATVSVPLPGHSHILGGSVDAAPWLGESSKDAAGALEEQDLRAGEGACAHKC